MCVPAVNPPAVQVSARMSTSGNVADVEPEQVEQTPPDQVTLEGGDGLDLNPNSIGDAEGSDLLGIEQARRRKNPFLSGVFNIADTGFTPVSGVTLGA